MNTISISLNNRAVEYLQAGKIIQAFDLLEMACNITMSGVANRAHVDAGQSTFRFHWEDCSQAGIAKSTSYGSSREGSAPFLFVKALRVSVAEDINALDEMCPCGFAWTVWFNFALCCCLIGTRLDEKGQKLLKTAFDLYNRVQKRIDGEQPSKHWDLLQMAVTNNQACIYHDYAMGEETRECLDQLAITLLNSKHDLEPHDSRSFFFNLQILGSDYVAAAA
jgi:hypothetical protein